MAKRTHCDRCDNVIAGATALVLEIPAKMLGLGEKFTVVKVRLKASASLGEGVNGEELDLCAFCQNETVDVISEQVGELRDRGGNALNGTRRF